MKKLKYRDEITAIIAIVLFYVIMETVGITCPILYLTGVSCAGCGMSRAWISVIHGDIHLAMQYHPLFWMVPPMGLLLLFRERLSAKGRRWSVIIIGLLFLGVYFFRMFDTSDAVVYFDPQSGMIAKGIAYIFHYIQVLT